MNESLMDSSFYCKKVPLNNWDVIIERIAALRDKRDAEEKIDLLIELFVNVRLLDKEERIFDARTEKGDMEIIYEKILDETRLTLAAEENPSNEYIYYFRELLKNLPIRGSNGGDIIGDIRGAAEQFEEGRVSDDPMRSFAGDLRKEVHRKLSPRILSRYIQPYMELIRHNNREPLAKAGYMALAASFNPQTESQEFIKLAEEMESKLSYLWDYECGDIVMVKQNLERRLDLFDKCFMRREMEIFLSICTAERIADTHNLVDCLNRLTHFKMLLKKSYREKRIGLFDFLNLDLDIGRLIFIFTNDLTNNHYAAVTFANVKESAALVRELIVLLSQKGILPKENDQFLRELAEISEMETLDILRTKRTLESVLAELQHFMQNNIFSRVSQMLNAVLEAYEIPLNSFSSIKDRFFNNFIRITEFHAVSEFMEKIILFLTRELAARNAENSLYGRYKVTALPELDGNYDDFIATTWTAPPDSSRPFLGGKGNGIIDAVGLGVATPPAFILGLPICSAIAEGKANRDEFRAAVKKYLDQLEQNTGKKLGDADNPLLVSVRSGTTVSLPGSMCTVLNVGITPKILEKLAEAYGSNFADSIYLRFLRNVLVAASAEPVEMPSGTKAAITAAEERVRTLLGGDFLSDPFNQLVSCIELVFASSRLPSVREYLRELSIEIVYGTAVTVQQMVFGNKNQRSMSGVLFTRNPINGSDELFGEYKEMAQGEDVVMGNIATRSIATLPGPIREGLLACKKILEKEFKYELDIEFTVDDGKLYLLQTRRATISTYAKLVVDTDMLKKGIITVPEFRRRMEKICATNAFISVPRPDEGRREWQPPISKGVPINHGIACGTLALSREKIEERKARHENAIYFAQNTTPADFYMLNNAHGIATIFPGRTSHAAITSITLNKPCIVGCSNAVIDLARKTVTFKGEEGDLLLKEGDVVTLDANSGCIYKGTVLLSNSFIRTNDILESMSDAMSPAEAAGAIEHILRAKIAKLEKEMGSRKKSLESVPEETFRGKTVLVRLDLNVPLAKGVITNTARIDAALPTVRHLLRAGATPVICSHLGEPDKQEKKGKSREEIYSEYSLRPVAEYIRAELGDVVFHEKSIASSGVLIKKEAIVSGKVNILENLRFAMGEKENDPVFARGLAGLSDGIFVNDAFGSCHRSHASIVGVTRYVETKLAGFLICKELKYLGGAVSKPQRPFVGITGGSKISSKLGVIESLLQKIDLLIVGGGIGYTLLKATGFSVQKSLVEESMLDTARKLMEKYGDKIVLPRDFVTTDFFDFQNQKVGRLERNVKTIPEGWESFDLGEESINNAISILESAKTVLWNGPIGAFEIKEGSVGTMRLARELARMAENGKTVIIGGGDSASAVTMAGVADKMTHVSTGGGASLEFLERLTLPGISVLDPEL